MRRDPARTRSPQMFRFFERCRRGAAVCLAFADPEGAEVVVIEAPRDQREGEARHVPRQPLQQWLEIDATRVESIADLREPATLDDAPRGHVERIARLVVFSSCAPSHTRTRTRTAASVARRRIRNDSRMNGTISREGRPINRRVPRRAATPRVRSMIAHHPYRPLASGPLPTSHALVSSVSRCA
jgi:hypothetical protein